MGVLAVCVLLVLAGCSAIPGGSGGAAAETTTDATGESETTAGTNGDSTGGDADLPPGLSTDGVTDAAALAAAHEKWLEGQLYTYDREVTVVARNGTQLGRWSQHVQVGANRLEFNHTQTGEGLSVSGADIGESQVYTDGSVTFWKADAFRDGFRREPGRGFAAATFSSEQLLADVLNASETSVTEVESGEDETGDSDGETRYRVRAENGSETLTYDPPNGTVTVEVTNVTATAVVAPSGFVRNVTYEFDFVRGNVSGHRTMTVRYTAVGETTVEVPAWVEDAKTVTDGTSETDETSES
jgi:hypothetical protein